MKLTKSKLREIIKEVINEAVGKAELKKMIRMAQKAGAKKYDIIKSLASDLSKSEDEIVSSLEKYNLIGMTEGKINEKTNYIGPFVFSDRTDKEKLLDIVFSAVDGYSNYTKGMLYKKSEYKKAYQEAEKILKKVHNMSSSEINRETKKWYRRKY